MSLEDRFRLAFDDAIAEVRTRLAAEFAATLTDARTEAERDKAAALAALEDAKTAELAAAEAAKTEALAAADAAKADALAAADAAKDAALADAKSSLEAHLLSAFQSEKETLASSHQTLLSQMREAAEGDAAKLREESAAEVARLRAELERVTAEAEATATRLRDEAAAAATKQREESEAAAAQLREAGDAEIAALRNDLEMAQAEALREREELQAAVTQARDQAAADVAQARQEGEAALATFRQEHEASFVAARADAQEAAAAHSQALEAQLTGAVRLLESVRALDGASSLSEVLDVLAYSAAKEAGRAAMLVVKGDRLIGWRTSGFGDVDQDPRSIESSTADMGALAAAVNTGRPAVVGSGSVLAAPSFSQLPADRPGLAVPLLVASRTVAVLYTDTGTAGSLSSAWTSPVEVLVRHAGRCLEGMAVSRGAHAKAAGARVGTPA